MRIIKLDVNVVRLMFVFVCEGEVELFLAKDAERGEIVSFTGAVVFLARHCQQFLPQRFGFDVVAGFVMHNSHDMSALGLPPAVLELARDVVGMLCLQER